MTRLLRLALVGVTVFLNAGAAPAQDATGGPQIKDRVAVNGTARVSGVVTSAERGNLPVRRALVTLRAADGFTNWATVSDDSGRFTLDDLPPGRATLVVTKAGWVTTFYGARPSWRPPAVALALVAGEHISDLAVVMLPGSVITGRLTDERGRPLVGIEPTVLELRTLGRLTHLLPLSAVRTALPNATDDRGEFKVFGLPPGRYVVAARIANAALGGFETASANDVRLALEGKGAAGRVRAFTPTHYPGTSDAGGATLIDLAAGEERAGVDFVVQPVPAVAVSGVITRPDGVPHAGALAVLSGRAQRPTTSVLAMRPVTTTADATGAFHFPAVPVGRYVVRARAESSRGSAVPDLWGEVELDVGPEPLSDVALRLQQGVALAGVVRFEGDASRLPKDLSLLRVALIDPRAPQDPAFAPPPTAALSAVGGFDLGVVPPGDYFVRVTWPPLLPDGWLVRSIVVNRQEMRDRQLQIRTGQLVPPIQIVVTDRGAELSGRLLDPAGRPAPEYFVFAFPADRALWHEHALQLRPPARPSTDGRYRLAPLPAGDYYLVPLTEVDRMDFVDPAFLERLIGSALPITLGEGERVVQDLVLNRGRE